MPRMSDPETDTRKWCSYGCDFGSTEPSCLFCGAPMTADAPSVQLHEVNSEAQLRILQAAMSRIATHP
jgi:hypothetical protein